jgi:threonine dehydrogenase-like Zn-dependent dehydrogenase
VLLFGINHTANAAVHQSDITMREITVLGSVTSRFTIPIAIRAIEQNMIDVGRLAIHESSIEDAVETVDFLRQGRYMKAVICPPR